MLLSLPPRHRKDPHKEEKALAEVTCTTVDDKIAKPWRKSSSRFHPNVDITPLYLVLLTDRTIQCVLVKIQGTPRLLCWVKGEMPPTVSGTCGEG